MQDKPRDSTVNAAVLARQTPGFSGAELSNLVNEAALLAAKTSKPSLSAELLDSARDKALMGVERRWVGITAPWHRLPQLCSARQWCDIGCTEKRLLPFWHTLTSPSPCVLMPCCDCDGPVDARHVYDCQQRFASRTQPI